MTQTPSELITNARTCAHWAGDALVLARFENRDWMMRYHMKEAVEYLKEALRDAEAAAALTQDKPDSGRASIPETEPEVGEQV